MNKINAFILIAVFLSITGCGMPTEKKDMPSTKPIKAQENAAVSVDPAKAEEAEKLFQSGLAEYEKYEYRKAVEIFDRAIAADKSNFKIYTAKGIALCFDDDYEQGIAMINKTLSMKPDYVPAFYDMAMAYKLQGKNEQALQWFEKTIQGDVKNTWSYYGIATIYADRGDKTRALEYLKKAIALDAGVKAVAREQDHFRAMRTMPEFKELTY